MKDFLQFADKANQVVSEAALFHVLLDAVRDLGFESATFNLLTDHKGLRVSKGVALLNNVADGVLDEYFRQGYDKADPVLSHAKVSPAPFEWDSLYRNVLSPKQGRCLDFRTRDAGYHNGVTVPLFGPANRRAAISVFTRGEKAYPNHNAGLLSAYGNYFYHAFQRLHQGAKSAAVPYIVLTPAETDILTYAATGKSDLEISVVLQISRHTVNAHFRAIFRKLDTNNRVHAVTRALLLGLISP